MSTAVNWIFILLGIAIGAPIGYAVRVAIQWWHRTRAGIRLALPAIRMAGMASVGLLVLLGIGLVAMGVL